MFWLVIFGLVVGAEPVVLGKPAVGLATMKTFDPHEEKDITYQGYRTTDVLESVFGPAWHQAEIVIFKAADGYASPVPRALLESKPSLLALARGDQSAFTVDNLGQHEKDVPLGPYYLVWPNEAGSGADGTFWPYQVVALELATFADKFANLVPAPPVSAQVARGFEVFQGHCLSCHSIGGQGGVKGGPLPLDKMKFDDSLRAWIADPTGGMPPLNRQMPDRDGALDAVVAYLAHMAKR